MKLFVWCDPYPVKYGGSTVFAIAENLEDAKKELASGAAYSYGKYKKSGFDGAYLASTLGEPNRIVDIPCAEWHEWSE